MDPEVAEQLALQYEWFSVRKVDDATSELVCRDCCKPHMSGKRTNAGVYTTAGAAKAHASLHKKRKLSQRAQRNSEGCTGGPVQQCLAGHSSWQWRTASQQAQHAHMFDSLKASTEHMHVANDCHGGDPGGDPGADPAPNLAIDHSLAENEYDSHAGGFESDSQSEGCLVDSDDSGHVGTVDEAGRPFDPDEVDGPARDPRKGSGAQLHRDRLHSIADGHPQTSLQAAYSLVEAKESGASNTVIDLMAMNQYLQLTESPNVSNVNFPKSHHLVKAVLGTEDAQKYEFGCCPKCAWRYETDLHREDKSKATLLKETCPQCAHPKYQVLSMDMLCNGSTVL